MKILLVKTEEVKKSEVKIIDLKNVGSKPTNIQSSMKTIKNQITSEKFAN